MEEKCNAIGLSVVAVRLCAQAPKTVQEFNSSGYGELILGASLLAEGSTMGAITDVDAMLARMFRLKRRLFLIGKITSELEFSVYYYCNWDTKVLEEVVVTAQGLNRKQKAFLCTKRGSEELDLFMALRFD